MSVIIVWLYERPPVTLESPQGLTSPQLKSKGEDMPRAWRLAWVGLIVLELAAGAAQAVHLRGQIVRVGYVGSSRQGQGDTTGADHFRIGFYTPILVELTNDDADTFTGVIEARQIDRDGDEVVARLQVMVSGTRRYYLYVPAGEAEGGDRFAVRVLGGEDGEEGLARLFDDANQPVRELVPASDPVPIEPESRVILDISDVNSLRELVDNTRLNRPVTVLRVSARDLPTDPVGLEMVDTVIWDGGDLESFRDPGQREALLEWTRRGGRLVIGVSRNWQQLDRSKFGEALPARLTGTASMSILDSKWVSGFAPEFKPPLTYCPVPLRSLAEDALPLIPGIDTESPPTPGDLVLAARRPFGRGDVVLVTAELRELLDPKRGSNLVPGILLSRLVGLRSEEAGDDDTGYPREDLFQYFEQQTGFQVTTQFYLLFAFVFVVGYVLLATGGTWLWLKKRGLVHYAWTGFALVAAVASGVSLVAVHLVRGVGYRVQELAIVDAQAGSPEATAISYFGLKTPTHTSLDLRIASRGRPVEDTPDGTTCLRPLPVSNNPMAMSGSQFRAGQRYEAAATLGELHAVPLRATLKQLEGFWRGKMDGQLQASLQRRGGELSADSYIQNNLGTDLAKCYLLVPTSNAGWPDRRNLYAVRSYYLGDLRNGQKLTFAEIEAALRKNANLGPDDRLKPVYLSENQESWLRRFGVSPEIMYGRGSLREEQKLDLGKLNEALILVSTFDEIGRKQRKEVSRSQGQHLDRSLALSSRMAMLIGFSEDPGPATLCWRPAGDTSARWRPVLSEPGRKVMYRFAIPIRPW